MSQIPKYYQPYESDTDANTDANTGEDTDANTGEDTGEDTGADTDADTDEDIRIRREEDPRYAMIRAAGPILNTSAQQLKYMEHAPGAEYSVDTNISSLSGLSYLNPPKTTITTLFSLKSGNRDKSVYPSQFNFQIKLPRVYKNVTKFQLVQLSFPYNTQDLASKISFASTLSTFIGSQGFNASCISACVNTFTNTGTSFNSLGVVEQNRLTSNGSQMLTKIEIPEGNFTNSQLAAQLTTEANNTPPFNLISYDDFKNAFKVTRDITLLFNEPGDNYHSKLSSTTYKHHSKETIMNMYYSRHDIDKHPVITDTIAFNAYYYPVLKELIITELGSHFITTTLSTDQLKYYVLNSFLGLDSKIYYEICLINQPTLDEFRKNLTFQHRNINKYVWSYDDKFQRFNCTHETLHTSLISDINKSLNKFISEELQVHSLNSNSFSTLKTNNAIDNTILDNLQTNLSTVFTSYFMENYQYSGDLYSNKSFSDLHNDELFTNMFNYTKIFGRQYDTFAGKSFTFTNFLDYHSTISSYYNIVQSTSNTISTINGNIYDRHHTYISSKYATVFSNDMIENRSYITAQSLPVGFVNNVMHTPGTAYTLNAHIGSPFDDCVTECRNFVRSFLLGYYSCLPVNTVITFLNYKLGLQTTGININSITTIFSSFANEKFDFFLQINPEQSFNNMDVGMPENYNISNETTGQTKLMYAKILTAGLGAGETSQTCIQNPIVFTNPLGKLDKLSFKIYIDNESLTPMWRISPFGSQINEWNATFQIDEQVGYTDEKEGWGTNPTIPISSNPASFPYMGLTSNK